VDRLRSKAALALLLPLGAADPGARGVADVPAPARPNVVLVLTDDQGYGDFGFAGNEVVRTPHLDAMAERSAWLDAFYVTPVCALTRASLMTGRYHPRTGVIENGLPMDPGEVTIAERLRDAGYATGLFGKWHLGRHHPRRARDQGFEECLTFRGGILRELEDVPVSVRYTDPALEHNGKRVRAEGYATDVFFDAALDWIEAVHREGRPFFATIATAAPHGPFDDVPAEHLASYRDAPGVEPRLARIYAMITKIDDNVGRLFGRLDALDLVDDTLVLFLSDNGPNGARYTAGLRGTKSTVDEGGIRVPLLAHWPVRLTPRRITGAFGAHVDLVPTLLDACGLAPARGVDGRSLLPLLAGEEADPPERTVILQAHSRGDLARNWAVRSGRWKLVHAPGYQVDAGRPGPPRLFEVERDPGEAHDVAAEHPDVVRALEAQHALWIASFGKRRGGPRSRPLPAIGEPAEDPLLITRRPEDLDQGDRWMVRVVQAGRYEVRFRFRPVPVRGRAMVQLSPPRGSAGGPSASAVIRKGDGACVFPALELTPGRWLLEGSLMSGELRRGEDGVWQVEIRRL
jgi:arylsulfatase/arylsulfatase A